MCRIHSYTSGSCNTKGVVFEPEKQSVKGVAIEKPLFVDQGCLEMIHGTDKFQEVL